MHFIVGIDLGTTNCAVSFVEKGDLAREPLHIQTFDIPQLTRPGAVEARPLLPSFLYQTAPSELPEGSTVLPWDKKNKMIVGELARSLGAKVPGRLVASAKSWLCSPSVDRTAAILPWGAPEDVKRVSPVEASAFYLDHIREAWDHVMAKGHPERKLAEQDIVITVPASFDEAARELTVQAAKAAGLETITLLEEPQAAFYAWMAAHAKSLDKHLKEISRVLVCDVGGGTTDFSLIEVHRTGEKKSPLEMRRSAVGDHLMLGGDNMDLALSRFLEKKINGVIDAHQFKALTAAAREGKERIYSDGAPAKVPITVMGRGSSVIGGSVKTELLQSDAGAVLLDGFFPVSRLEDNPVTTGRAGIREWGLPYVNDPAVTRHLSQFLRHHAKPPDSTLATIEQRTPKPDAILFNGGAMKPAAFRERVLSVVKNWFGGADVEELGGTSLDLAVAQGAAYYGCVRRGRGVRIGGGMGRGYYIGIETDPSPQNPSGKAAICLVPQGTEEGDEIELPQSFILRLATPVVFPLFSSSVRAADKLGAIIDEESKDLAPLPPLETMLHGGRRATKKDVSVRLHASLTEVGTLGLSLKAVSDDRSWEIHLNVRSKVAAKSATEAEAPKDASGGVDPRKIDAALALVNRTFDPKSRDPIPPGILTKQMEAALALSKEAWPASLARRLADAVLSHADQRTRSPEHEARWLNLVGYLLRPGFGDIADAERMRKLYNATRNALNFVSDPNARIEWWVLWRRVSGGLKEDQERELFYRLQPFLTNDRDVSKRGGWPRPTKGEVPEMWRAAASLELLDLAQKKMLGQLVLDQMEDEGPSTAMFWTLARLGARQPAHASPHNAVPPDVAEAWLKALLVLDWAGNPMAVFAAVNLARKTGDRTRDVGEAARLRIMDRLKKAGAGEHDIAAVKSVTELENTDRKMIFGDALPPALKMEAQ